jgi:hypothetical protein
MHSVGGTWQINERQFRFREATMKRVIFAWFFAFVPACIAPEPLDNDGDQPSTEASLAGDIDAWCDATCARLEDCPEQCECEGDLCSCSGGIDDDCPEDCRDALEEYLGRGDDCAELGRGLMACVDQIKTCDDLYAGHDCEAIDEDEACERSSGDDVSPPSSRYVTCAGASGSGSAGAAGGGNVSAFSCETSYEECSDGALYRLVCNGTSEVANCHCFRSGEFTGSFEVSPGNCPSGVELNAGCGWSLNPGY